MSRPRVLLAATGGTIGSRIVDGRLVSGGGGAAALIDLVPELSKLAEVVPLDVCDVLSHAMTPQHMRDLAHTIEKAIDDGYRGIVVTHGTDTLEETAYALALQVRPRIPVVLTGAMRTTGAAGSDGPTNLLAALRVALSDAASRLGPVVAIQDEIHLARWIAKSHTARVAAFASSGFGPIGTTAAGEVHVFARDVPTDYLGLPPSLQRRVEVIVAAAGADGLLVEAAAKVADGIVVAGTGGGHVPPAMVPALKAAVARGIPVVLSSRTGAGPLLRGAYGGHGSDEELRAIGLIPAGMLAPLKARLRLMVALELGMNAASAFAE